MIAQRLSKFFVEPLFKTAVVLGAKFAKLAWIGFIKLITFLLTDFASVACCAAIAWGVHYWSLPAAWITAGVLGIVLIGMSQMKLR